MRLCLRLLDLAASGFGLPTDRDPHVRHPQAGWRTQRLGLAPGSRSLLFSISDMGEPGPRNAAREAAPRHPPSNDADVAAEAVGRFVANGGRVSVQRPLGGAGAKLADSTPQEHSVRVCGRRLARCVRLGTVLELLLADAFASIAMLTLLTLLDDRSRPVATTRGATAAARAPIGHRSPTPGAPVRDDADYAPGPAATELMGHPTVDRARAAQHLVRTMEYQPERFARMRDEAVTAALTDGYPSTVSPKRSMSSQATGNGCRMTRCCGLRHPVVPQARLHAPSRARPQPGSQPLPPSRSAGSEAGTQMRARIGLFKVRRTPDCMAGYLSGCLGTAASQRRSARATFRRVRCCTRRFEPVLRGRCGQAATRRALRRSAELSLSRRRSWGDRAHDAVSPGPGDAPPEGDRDDRTVAPTYTPLARLRNDRPIGSHACRPQPPRSRPHRWLTRRDAGRPDGSTS